MTIEAEFRHLIFVNYQVDRNLLEPRVPDGVQLQLFNGKAYLSLVAFLFKDLKISGIPAPFHQEFEEVNLRFYVKQGSAEGEKWGVVFIREIVPKAFLAAAARALFNEKYISLPMRHHFEIGQDPANTIEYRWWGEQKESYVRAVFSNEWTYPEKESAPYFFSARPFGFTQMQDGSTRQITIEHPLWRTTPVTDSILEYSDIPQNFGVEFVPYLTLKPNSVFIAEGSAVTVKG